MNNWKLRLRQKVWSCLLKNEYPSAYRLSKTGNLNGRECKYRTELFKEFGVKKKLNQYV